MSDKCSWDETAGRCSRGTDGCPEKHASELAAPIGYALEIKLKGETPEQLWGNLLGLITYAIECKNAQGGHWPHMVSTDDGKISVRHNKALSESARDERKM